MNFWTEVLVWYLFFIKVATIIRDALDTTPGNDVNAWEKAVTFLNKIGGALIAGKRVK